MQKSISQFQILFLITLSLTMLSCKVIDEIKKELYVKITTDNISNVSFTSAVIGGNISDDGGKPISEKGICYSKTPNPTTVSFKIQLGAGIGSFEDILQKLETNTTYYVRAYCINAYGTTYGNEVSFKTLDYSIPIINSISTTSLTEKAIGLSGILDYGGATPIEWGFCYSESPNPTIASNKINSQDLNGPIKSITYTGKLNNLKSNTIYYIRGYCTTIKGTGYSEQITIKTLEDPVLLAFLSSLKSGLQVFYPFDGNANDASGNQKHGTVNNVKLTTDRNGNNNAAFSFDGQQGTNISTNYPGILGTGARSFSFWIKRKELIYNGTTIFSYGNSNTYGQGVNIGLGKIDENPLILFDNTGSASSVYFNMIDDKWHHYVMVWDKSFGQSVTAVKFYIDGVEKQSSWTYNPTIINTIQGTNLIIGQYTSNDNRNFFGSIDDLGIWNRVLTDAEIKYLFSNDYNP